MFNQEVEGYRPLFELGLFEDEHPAIRVVQEVDVCPGMLASLVTALFETVMRNVPDSKQLSFETRFNESLSILMKERFNYDVSIKYPKEDEEDD